MNNREERFAVKFNTDQSVYLVEMKPDQSLLDFCYSEIGCDYIETVRAQYLEQPYILIIDEEGRMKDEQKINFIASYLYGTQEHHEPIVGNVLVMKIGMTSDGPDIIPLDKEDATVMAQAIRSVAPFVSLIVKGALIGRRV